MFNFFFFLHKNFNVNEHGSIFLEYGFLGNTTMFPNYVLGEHNTLSRMIVLLNKILDFSEHAFES